MRVPRELPGLREQVRVMDQPGMLVVLVKDVPMGIDLADSKRMMRQKGGRQLVQIAVCIQPLVDLPEIPFDVESARGTVDEHYAQAPMSLARIGFGFGQKLAAVQWRVEQAADVLEADHV